MCKPMNTVPLTNKAAEAKAAKENTIESVSTTNAVIGMYSSIGANIEPVRDVPVIPDSTVPETLDETSDIVLFDDDSIVKQAAEEYRNKVKNGEIKKTTGGKLKSKVATVGVDSKTGKLYYGLSGMGHNPTRNSVTHPTMQNMLKEKTTQTNYPLENCGEFNVINNALHDGAEVADLRIYSVLVTTGDYYAPCINCQNLYGESVHFIT